MRYGQIIAKLLIVNAGRQPPADAWHPYCSGVRLAHLFSPSHARENDMRRQELIMKDLKRMLLIAVMLCIPSIGAFAQEQKKPTPPVIVAKPKDSPPPERDKGNDQQKKGGDDNNKKKP